MDSNPPNADNDLGRAAGRVYTHSCEDMRELPAESADLTITSPPYWNSIDYATHASEGWSEDFRARREGGAAAYGEYLDFLRACFRETLRVHKPGSFCAVVIGTVLFKGEHTPLPFHFVPLMEELGWRFHQDIVWFKCTGGVKRAGSTICNPFPGDYYPNLMTEYILVFRKPGERRIYEGKSPGEKEAARNEVDSVFTRDVANNIWHIAPVPPGQLDHPCPFPEEIAYRLIRWYSYPGGVVLDPFCGVGTTLKVAAQTGRRWVGYEIVEKYAESARKRVKEPLQLRKQLVPAFEKIHYGERTARKSSPARKPFRQKPKSGK